MIKAILIFISLLFSPDINISIVAQTADTLTLRVQWSPVLISNGDTADSYVIQIREFDTRSWAEDWANSPSGGRLLWDTITTTFTEIKVGRTFPDTTFISARISAIYNNEQGPWSLTPYTTIAIPEIPTIPIPGDIVIDTLVNDVASIMLTIGDAPNYETIFALDPTVVDFYEYVDPDPENDIYEPHMHKVAMDESDCYYITWYSDFPNWKAFKTNCQSYYVDSHFGVFGRTP